MQVLHVQRAAARAEGPAPPRRAAAPHAHGQPGRRRAAERVEGETTLSNSETADRSSLTSSSVDCTCRPRCCVSVGMPSTCRAVRRRRGRGAPIETEQITKPASVSQPAGQKAAGASQPRLAAASSRNAVPKKEQVQSASSVSKPTNRGVLARAPASRGKQAPTASSTPNHGAHKLSQPRLTGLTRALRRQSVSTAAEAAPLRLPPKTTQARFATRHYACRSAGAVPWAAQHALTVQAAGTTLASQGTRALATHASGAVRQRAARTGTRNTRRRT
jgi:hypothetical protein